MKNYAISTRITAILTCAALAMTLIIHYGFHGTEAEFWCNVCLAVFGSGLLTFITACIGYATEKRRTLESFSYSTRSLLRIINKYDLDWGLEKKIDFFLDYADVDKAVWDAHMGAIHFLYDPNREKYKYIYQNIYKPILDLNQRIAAHGAQFKWHKDGSGKKDIVMAEFISEIEALFMENVASNHVSEDGKELQTTLVRNKLVYTILKELNGRYYDIMYDKRRKRVGLNGKDENGID